ARIRQDRSVTTSIILDVDTGIDDALALMTAVRHPDLHVRAITCVAGNVALPAVVANTHAVLDLAGAEDVPVAAGADRPLVERPPGRLAYARRGRVGQCRSARQHARGQQHARRGTDATGPQRVRRSGHHRGPGADDQSRPAAA